jgi:hypothetical protein
MTVIGRCCSTLQQARFGQAVSGQLLALQRVDFVAEFGQANLLAGRDEGEGQAGRFVCCFRRSCSGPDCAQGDVEQAADQEGERHDHGNHGEGVFCLVP